MELPDWNLPEETDGIRLTWNLWPNSKLEATKCVIPFATMYTPNKQLPNMPVSFGSPGHRQVTVMQYLHVLYPWQRLHDSHLHRMKAGCGHAFCRWCPTSLCPASSAVVSLTRTQQWTTTHGCGSALSATRGATSHLITRASHSRTCLLSCTHSTPRLSTHSTGQCLDTRQCTCSWWTPA